MLARASCLCSLDEWEELELLQVGNMLQELMGESTGEIQPSPLRDAKAHNWTLERLTEAGSSSQKTGTPCWCSTWRNMLGVKSSAHRAPTRSSSDLLSVPSFDTAVSP